MRQKFSFPKNAPLGAFLSLFLFVLPWCLMAQGAGAPIEPSCTVFKKLGGLPSDYNGQVYYDRFGNTWSEDEILDLGANVNDDCTAGIFALDFSGTYTIGERDAVCEALSYLSGIVGGGAPRANALKFA